MVAPLRPSADSRLLGACVQASSMEWRFRIETGMNVRRHALDPQLVLDRADTS